MIIVTTLVIPPGGDAGPFDLYSDSDGYTVPFATNVSAAALQAGYSSTVPNDATIIRVISTGLCTNFIDLNINLITTTTTSSSSTSTSTSSSTTTSTSSSTTTSTTTTPDILPGVALTWTANNGPFTSIVFQITRKRAGVETVVSQKSLNNGSFPDPSGNYNGGAGSTFYSSGYPFATDAQLSVEGYYPFPIPSGLQTGDEIRIYLATTNISSSSNGGPVGADVQSTLILRRTLRTVSSYTTVDTQSDSGPSPAIAYIPMPPGTWYTVDPSTYIYDVIAITEIS